MSALKSVSIAIDLAVSKRDQSVKIWQQLQRVHLAALDQKSQLESYAAETEAKWTKAARSGATPEMMGHHYQFMGRLHHAIDLQKEVLLGASQRMDAARRLVLDAEIRLAGLQQVLKKKTGDLALQRGRWEQKQMDEFAAMQSRRVGRRYFGGEDHGH